jgi:hypothetical protein
LIRLGLYGLSINHQLVSFPLEPVGLDGLARRRWQIADVYLAQLSACETGNAVSSKTFVDDGFIGAVKVVICHGGLREDGVGVRDWQVIMMRVTVMKMPVRNEGKIGR